MILKFGKDADELPFQLFIFGEGTYEKAIQECREVIEINPNNEMAHQTLGSVLEEKGDWDGAINEEREALRLNPNLSEAHRNLGLAYESRKGDHAKSLASLEEAFLLEQDPRFLNELDTERELAGVAAQKRLDFLLKNEKAVQDRDDTLAREIELHVQVGHYDKALELLKSRIFHVWEGARFTAHDSYVDAQLLRAHALLKAGKADEALAGYKAALEYPVNLSTGKASYGDRSPEIDYFVGKALEAKHATAEAKEWYGKSAVLTMLRNVTERKRAEAALIQSEKLATVGRMAASIAHEINNPLAAAMNTLYIARNTSGVPRSNSDFTQSAESFLSAGTR